MKLYPADIDINTMIFHRLISENNLIEMGVFRVLYGWRVRAGFLGSVGVELDWCGGRNWSDVERLYSICLAILLRKEENEQCFLNIPRFSTIKPFYLDYDFVKNITDQAGDLKMISLEKRFLCPEIY